MTTPDTDPFGLASDSSEPALSHGGTVPRETFSPPDLETACKFLNFIHPQNSYILLGPDRRSSGTGLYWEESQQLVNHGSPIREKILDLQKLQRTIQFTPNVLKGRRLTSNVTHLNCFYLDVDKNVSDQEYALAQFTDKYSFHWHIKIETRPGKYQYFWLIDPVEKIPATESKYQQIAKELCTATNNAEGVTTDVSHFMRVPGCTAYRHGGNFYTKLIDFNDHIPRYSLEELASKFPPAQFNTKYVIPADNSVTRNRNNAVRDYLAHLCGTGTPTVDDLDMAMWGFIERKIPLEYRDAGFMREIRDMPRRTFERLVKPKLLGEAHRNITLKPDEKLRETHPPELFLRCPGGVGNVIRYLSDVVPSIPPASYFVATFGVLSPIASYSVTDIHGNSPSTYMGIVAKSGDGKTKPMSFMRTALRKGGIRNSLFFTSTQATDTGVTELLRKLGGVGCMYTDEANQLFNALKSKNSPPYRQALAELLLSSWSASDEIGAGRGPSSKGLEKNEESLDLLDSIDCLRLSWIYGIQTDFYIEHFLDDRTLVTEGHAARILNVITHGAESSDDTQSYLDPSLYPKVWELISHYPAVHAALDLQYATHGLLPVDPEFTSLGTSDVPVVVADAHVYTNGGSNGHASNGLSLDVVPPQLQVEKRKRGRPKKDSTCGEQSQKCGFLPNPPAPITLRHTPEVQRLTYSAGGSEKLLEFRKFCSLRKKGTSASASIWSRGVEQVLRVSIFLRAFGAEEIEAIVWSIEFITGCFLALDNAYHKNGAVRSPTNDNTERYRKRLYQVILESGPISEGALAIKMSSNPKLYGLMRSIIQTEVGSEFLSFVPAKTQGRVVSLVRLPQEFIDS